MARRIALAAIGLSSILIVAFSILGGEVGELGFAVVAMAFPAALMLLGSTKGNGRAGRSLWTICLLLIWLELCLVGMFVFRGQVESGPWLFGLPAAAAIQLFGIFLAPLPLVALGYVLGFEDFGVSERDLERLRNASEPEDGA